MTNVALNIGLRSLLTAQYALDTIGHNIANANTPGFSRQSLDLSSELPQMMGGLFIGGGVRAGEVQRSVDALLNRRLLGQAAVGGSLASQLTGMTEVESLLGELDGHGVGALMDGLFSSFSALSGTPGDPILASGVGQAATALTDRFHSVTSGLSTLTQDSEKELGLRVNEVNQLADKILSLNQAIAGYESSGSPANDLRDQREVALLALSDLVDTETVEDDHGSVRVLVGGNTLVSSSHTYELTLTEDVTGDKKLKIEGASGYVPIKGGKLGGLLALSKEMIPELNSELDALARNLILEFNRVHSTGMPAGGPFGSLTGANVIQDVDKDGKLTDELLSKGGLPFPAQTGTLQVNVTDKATGEVTVHSIDVSSTHTTVGDFLDDLNALAHLSADVDSEGRMQVQADAGFAFDFTRRLDPNPDAAGTFGGGSAALGTGAGPFALADGDTLDLTVPAGGSSFQIALSTADFADIGAATAEEVAAVINADPSAQSSGLAATAVDGHLFLKTLSEGAAASFTLDGGSALAGLGLSAFAGTTLQGADNSVDVAMGGAYTGDAASKLTFVPNMDGVVGTTPGLSVLVYDEHGAQVGSLDVGEGYVPGTPLDVGDGVTAAFGLGELSASQGDLFALQLVADSDTSDVLVALGLNSFFTGTGASDIALRADLEVDPTGISTSLSGANGDNQVLLSLLGLKETSVAGLGQSTFSQSYEKTVGDFGFETAAALNAFESNESLKASLEQLQQSVSGVNVDEELVDLVRFEQAFAAAGQYISVVNGLQDELMNLI